MLAGVRKYQSLSKLWNFGVPKARMKDSLILYRGPGTCYHQCGLDSYIHQPPSNFSSLHLVNTAILRPPTHSLPKEVKHDAKATPEEDQAHVQHDGRHVAIGNDPWRDELAKPVAPHILIDRDGHEDAACDRLVGVHAVRTGDGGERRDLDARASVAHNYDCLLVVVLGRYGKDKGKGATYLPVPFVLVTESNDEVPDQHNQHVRDHSRQTHLRLADPTIPLRRARCDPI